MSPELIETILVTATRDMPLLPRHLVRLASSAQDLGYRCDEMGVETQVRAAARALTAPGPHRLRLLLDRAGQCTIQTAPLAPLPLVQEILIAPETLNASEPLLRYKTTHRPWYTKTIEWLPSHPHIFDLVYINQRGEVCEGSRSNVYVQQGDRWYTPPVDSGCLPGVQRAALLDANDVHERVLTVQDLREARALRLSNALRGWFDVVLRDA
ncbi:aminotransferase [Bordetella genomosp. 5]|uniref:aminotransferase class IV family protein n=1 Tax=Bordetella genomosp. 5 TaxID=1395608 RepID=UPI000B9DF10E|nr:aminotransferase class IV family protein [Bordetella genomosp. 5]OZI40116.1 aminotransferase [Bordetella genomosp. 5]